MELTDRLAICQLCKNRAMNPSIGTVCGLTMQKPNFEDSCVDYYADRIEINRTNERESLASESKAESSGSKATIWIVITVILIIVRIIIRLARN